MSNSFNPDELMKIFSSLKMPNMPDFHALAESQKRNLEALSSANRLAMEGAQAVARRNMEIMQQVMGELSHAVQTLTNTDGSPQDKASQQADMLKGAYERAVTNMQEVAELIQKSNGEAVSVINRRFTEALEEVKSLVHKG